jgi:hypothetical protein
VYDNGYDNSNAVRRNGNILQNQSKRDSTRPDLRAKLSRQWGNEVRSVSTVQIRQYTKGIVYEFLRTLLFSVINCIIPSIFNLVSTVSSIGLAVNLVHANK